MRLSPITAPEPARRGVTGEPFYFPSGSHTLFGWLHGGAPARAEMGVVLCGPFGYEAICGHRSLRAFAEATAAAGLPTLRFDYVGAGDSSDADPLQDQIEAWTLDIAAAVAELRHRTGVRRVCLFGLRLGALLAMRAAERCTGATAVIAVAPVINGRRYVRELRTMLLAAAQRIVRTDAVDTPAEEPRPAGPQAMEVSGFTFAAASVSALSPLDLTSATSTPVSDMLIIDRVDLPQARSWSDALTRLGVSVQYQVLPGFVEMMMTSPFAATVPQAMIEATCEWLQRVGSSTPVKPADRDTSAGCAIEQLPASMQLEAEAGVSSAMLTERPVHIESAVQLLGIATEPRSGEHRRRAVVLLNDGATHHVGANRMHTDVARLWARRGYFVLRVDLAGIGDSGTRPGRAANEVFPPAAIDDIRAAVEFVRANYAVTDVSLVGLCSGAYHSLRAAAAGVPVTRILLVNPQNFYWNEGMSLDDLQVAEVVQNPLIYRERVLSLASWRRLLFGRVNVWRIFLIFMHRFWLALESTARDLARNLGIRLSRDLGRELETIAGRGVQVVFVFSRGEAGIELLRILAGSTLKRLGERCRMHIVEAADHLFSGSRAKAQLQQVLSSELFAPREREPTI